MESYKHFTAIVIGENPDEIMKQYDLKIKVEPYVVYEPSKVQEYKKNTLMAYRSISESEIMPDSIREEYREKIREIEQMDDIDFYYQLTDDFDLDEETGNAMCDINPKGKYHVARLGKNLAMPLIDKNGNEVFQARKCDIDWSRVHLSNQEIYKAAWEMVMGDRKPVTEEETIVYENMKNRTEYFMYYGDENTYVASNTAFWGYAFVTNDNWEELPENVPQFEWVMNFYDRFIKNLPDNTLISVYECVRN